jgi:hypothetical protein
MTNLESTDWGSGIQKMNPADFPTGVLRKNLLIVSRKIEDEFVLVPIRRKPEDVDSIYVLNEVGSRIWELIDGQRTCIDIMDRILDEYDVSRCDAEQALVSFLTQLLEIGMVEEIAGEMPSHA